MIRAWAPEVIFLSLEDPEEAAKLCERLDAEFPALLRFGLAGAANPFSFRLALRFRMRELLSRPFEEAEVQRLLLEAERHLQSNPASISCCDRLYAFTSAKPGSGASVIAANAARAIQKTAEGRCLLADFDSSAGTIGFLFKMEHPHSVADALQLSKSLDDESWQRLIRRDGNLDVLLSGAPRLDDQVPKPELLSDLLHFVRRNYSTIIADLPAVLDATTLAVLREANHIFLVTTPELVSLRLARQKAAIFQKIDLENRVSLVVNRTHKHMELSLEDIEETVGLPVVFTFPCDYSSVTKSIRDAQQPSNLAAEFRGFAQKLTSKRLRERERKRFIERFSIVPARFSFH